MNIKWVYEYKGGIYALLLPLNLLLCEQKINIKNQTKQKKHILTHDAPCLDRCLSLATSHMSLPLSANHNHQSTAGGSRLQPHMSGINYCKVSIMCALGSVHSRPRDTCVAVDDSTQQCPTAMPLHATHPPPCPPLPLSFAQCLALATTQVPSPPDRESPLGSLATPAIVGSATRLCPMLTVN